MSEKLPEGEIFTGLPKALEEEATAIISETLGREVVPEIQEDFVYYDISGEHIDTADSGTQMNLIDEVKAVVGEGYDVSIGSRSEDGNHETLLFITKQKN